MSTLWRQVVGGRYDVSDDGRVWSWYLNDELWPELDPTNRVRYQLTLGGRRVHRFAHTLVLEQFVSPRPSGLVGRHLDGDVWHNHVANLEWATQAENMRDKARHGTHHAAHRVACPLGHRLVAPNLVVAALRRGGRNCLACDRARSFISWARRVKGWELDVQVTADVRYRKIMGIPAEDGFCSAQRDGNS